MFRDVFIQVLLGHDGHDPFHASSFPWFILIYLITNPYQPYPSGLNVGHLKIFALDTYLTGNWED